MVSNGIPTISAQDIKCRVSDAELLSHYLGIKEIPCIINSPLREDKKPSFGLYSPYGNNVYYHDFSTKERGSTYDLLAKLWHVNFREVLEKIYSDFPKFSVTTAKPYKCTVRSVRSYSHDVELKCKVRPWETYDIEYWESFGVPLKWLNYAEVYPISHKIIERTGERFTFGADKYAYAFVEHKEGKITLKIYQPFNKQGYKWCNKHDRSIVSLWTKVPKTGDKICICSSLKDALCVWANTDIPCLAVQGEGYGMSNTAMVDLKKRYKHIFVCFDNDKAGIEDGKKFSELTGFTNVVLPKFKGGKDCSDLYHSLRDKNQFKTIMQDLLKPIN